MAIVNNLPTRTLGKTGLEVTTLGVGCAWLGRRGEGLIDEEAGLAAILAALDSGVRLIDTASLYAEGTAERVVGQALRARPAFGRQVLVQAKARAARGLGQPGARDPR